MTRMLYAVARFSVRRRFVVLAVWLLAAIALVAISHRMGDNTNDNLSLPGTNSQQATNTLTSSFPAQPSGGKPDFPVWDGRREAAADRDRDLRAAFDPREHPHAGSCDERPYGGPDACHDDRSGRGDRLCAVHRHPPFPRLTRGAPDRRIDRPRGGHVWWSRVLRRLHSHDRARLARCGR